MTILSVETVCRIVPAARPHIPRYIQPLNETMDECKIDGARRVAMFIAQLAHESMEFARAEEMASGEAYEGRADLGNTQPGDGRKFKGRGLIQVTGRANYAACSKYLAGSEVLLLENPELLADDPVLAVRSAGWFWVTRNLNRFADTEDIMGATRRINGGLNGLQERSRYWRRGLEILVGPTQK